MRKGGTYLAIGDSITWQIYGAGGEVYGSKIRNSIRNNYAPIQFVNKGIGGTHTRRLLNIMDSWMGTIPFDLVTVGVGMNDSANQLVTVSEYGDNLRKIVDKLRIFRPNCEIILCAPSATSDATRIPYIANYRTKMQEVATEKGTKYCNFGLAFSDAATYTNDGVHPTEAGHQLIHDLLYPIIQQTKFVDKLI